MFCGTGDTLDRRGGCGACACAAGAQSPRGLRGVDLPPPGIRAIGLALTYALGVGIFGGTAAYVVTWLVGVTGDPLASTCYVMGANVVVLLAALAIRNSDASSAAWPAWLDREV
jgi:hypothetical protein